MSLEHSGEHDHFVALEVNEALGYVLFWYTLRSLPPLTAELLGTAPSTST